MKGRPITSGDSGTTLCPATSACLDEGPPIKNGDLALFNGFSAWEMVPREGPARVKSGDPFDSYTAFLVNKPR